MIPILNTTHQDAAKFMRERSQQIYEKLKSGETEEAVVTGGNAFTETVWEKLLQNVDDYLEQVKEDQQLRFSKMDEEKEDQEIQLAKQDRKDLEKDFMEKCIFERNVLQEKLLFKQKIKENFEEE